MNEVEVVTGEVVWMDGSLEADERIIERGLSSFVEVGAALAHIRDQRLYHEAGFDTFEDYCRERWDMGHRYASNQIDAARVVAAIETGAHAPVQPPQFEAHARPLVKVLNEQGEGATVNAWSQIVEAHEGEGSITGREVARFLRVGGGANYGKPGWHELLGEVGDTLIRADKQLSKVEDALTRRPNEEFRAKAGRYALWASDLAARLREIEAA